MTWQVDQTQIVPFLRAHGLGFKRRNGSQWLETPLCPFCQGGNSRDKGTWAIHAQDGNYACKRGGCGEAGSFWQLCEYFNEDPKQYHTQSNNVTPISKPKKAEPIPPKEYVKPQTQTTEAPDAVREYLHGRGFSDETINACGVKADADGNVVFTYTENGQPVFIKFRHARETQQGERKAWAEAGGKRVLWGLDQCDPSAGPLVICFGEYDRMAAYEAGVSNAVSVPSGDADKGWIDLCWGELERYEQIVLWVDNDKPDTATGVRSGEKALHEIAPRLGKYKIRVVESKFKDANEMLVQRGKQTTHDRACQEIRDIVEKADWYPHDGLIRVSDIGERPARVDGICSGLKPLDEMTGGFRGGEVTIHTGDNGAGKTSGLLGLCSTAIEEGKPVCVWSGELDRYTFRYWSHLHMAGVGYLKKSVSQKTGLEYYSVPKPVEEAINAWHRDLYFLYDRVSDVHPDRVFETFELAYRRHGCHTFVIDNLMALMIGCRESEKLSMQRDIVARAKAFAVNWDVHVHVVAHINKAGNPLEPPTKDQISGAKEITNLVDNVLAWWRVPKAARVGELEFTDGLLCLLKNRMFGTLDNVRLQYDKDARRFCAQSQDWKPLEYGWTRYLNQDVSVNF